MINTIFFDWNATLFADTQACIDADNQILKSFGKKPITLAFYRKEFTMPVRDFYIKAGLDRAFIENHPEEIAKIFHTTYEERAKKCRTRAGATELLRSMHEKNIKNVIVSNHTVHGIEFQLRRLKLDKYISKIMANREDATATIKLTKERFVRNYMSEHNVKINDAVIVGDAPEEIEIGKSLGIKTIAITGGYYATSRLKNLKPDYLVHNLMAIKSLLNRL